jgi:hypothetical protein
VSGHDGEGSLSEPACETGEEPDQIDPGGEDRGHDNRDDGGLSPYREPVERG